ncbi:MAG: hypothetical protein LBP88_07935 [Treponema sp.]|jgi:hypothetical protein|nr:hypothetical protein [Treponema sp.]
MIRPLRFIVLIPHRDSGRLLWDYRRELFAAGLVGAYSFPGVAPWAVVSQAFTQEDLQALARTLRDMSVQDGRGGKISTQGLGSLGYSAYTHTGQAHYDLTIFGPLLDLPSPDFSHPQVVYRFPRLVLAAGLIKAEAGEAPLKDLPKAPVLFFRAGMVANMVFRPLSSGAAGYSFEWRIGTPLWLPSHKITRPRYDGSLQDRGSPHKGGEGT